MSTTKTKNLKLTIDSSSTDSAKKNLEKIDAALANVPTDNAGNLLIKSKGNIAILPENTDVGGSATDGGVITFGEPSKPVDSVEFYADSVALGREVVITDSLGSESLAITFSGEDANLDVNIIADVDIKLRGNLETTAAIKLTGPADVTLPVNGVLLSEDSTNVLTNKSIDAQDNTLTNIGVSSLAPGFVLPAANVDLAGQIDNADVSPTAAIDYSKLNMTGLIVNSDISNSAAIAKSKLNLTNAITNADISPSAAIPASKLDLSNSIVDASVSASAAIDRSKLAAGPVGQAVMNDPTTGLLVSVGALPRTAGGTGVASSATFPTSGTVLTDTNNVTVSNKVISGANNSLDSIPKSAVLLSNAITNADVNTSAAIDYSKLDLADSIEDSDVSSTAAIAGSKIDADFGNQPVVSNVGIDLPVGGWTTRLQAAQAGQTADVTFELPNAPGSPGQVLTDDGTGKWVYQTVSGSGTVTSVALSMPAEFSVAGSPITTTGTLAVSKAVQNQNKVFAGPITGADAVPTFRVLDADDIPTLPYAKVTIVDGDLTIAKTSGLQAALDGKIDENAPITGATKTKITYDANGLVTAGADLTAGDLPAGTVTETGTQTLTNKTLTSPVINTPTGIVKGDVGLGNVDNTSDATKNSASATLTNKTIVGDDNTIQDVALSSLKTIIGDANKALVRNASGVVISSFITNDNIDNGAAISFSKMIGLTADRVAITDGAGEITNSSITTTTLSYLDATSSIQTQLNGKQSDVITTQGDLIIGDVSGDAVRLGIGPIGYTLISDGTTFSWQPVPVPSDSFKTDWVLGDGASKTIVHSLGTKDISVEIFDKTDGQTIGVDTVIRTDDNTLDLTASSAPGAAGWRVLIRKV